MSRVNLVRRLCVVLAVSFILVSQAYALDNKGKEFILSFLPQYSAGNIELHLTADEATDVTIHYPVNSPTFTQTISVSPGSITTVALPIGTMNGWTPGVADNNSVRAFADKNFLAYMINRSTSTSDAALALPVRSFNTEYIVTTYDPLVESEFAVTAAYDGTTVTITPTQALTTGQSANTSFQVTLNKGQAFLGTSSVDVLAGLTGTIIKADKPVGVSNGNKCAYVGAGSCDHLFEVAQPVQSWGMEFIAANVPNRSAGSYYRIVASEDNTVITRNGDGTAVGTINRGEFVDINGDANDFLISATKPVFVTQFQQGKSGSDTGQIGDPASGNVVPAAQYLTGYTFSTVGGGQFPEHHLVLVASSSDVSSIKLDGSLVGSGNFSAVTGTSDYKVARLVLTEGTHTTSSINPHGIMVVGYGGSDSYQYPGGTQLKAINPVGDKNAPTCAVTINSSVVPNTATGTASDNRPTEDTNGNDVLDSGEDLNNNGEIDTDTGIYSIELASGASNLNLTVNSLTPGDGTASFSLSVISDSANGTGTVVVTDGAGNTCEKAVTLSVQPDADGDGVPDVSDNCPSDSNASQIDTDSDGAGDACDDDDDGDSIPDADEGSDDTDNDGMPDSIDDDSDNDGIADSDEGNQDSDGDGIPNYQDEDSDNDGISDSDEGNGDSDNDGTEDLIDRDSDSDGIPDVVEGNGDTDSDGIPDYLDRDSDNDGIPDSVEAQSTEGFAEPTGTDTDGDGIDDAYDPDNGGTSALEDTDEDGTPDYLDSDSDGDGVSDLIEAHDNDGDGVVDTVPSGTDANGDGIDDAFAGLSTPSDFNASWRSGTSGEALSLVKKKKRARKEANTMENRVHKFAKRAGSCSGVTFGKIRATASRVYKKFKRRVKKNYTDTYYQCEAGETGCVDRRYIKAQLKFYTKKLYRLAKYIKNQALKRCPVEEHDPNDTRNDTDDDYKELKKAVNKLPDYYHPL